MESPGKPDSQAQMGQEEEEDHLLQRCSSLDGWEV